MQVDPEILRSFAAQVGTAATAVETADVGDAITNSAAALAGSTTDYIARAIGAHIGGLVTSFGDQIDEMRVAVRGVAGDFVAHDDAIATSFDQIWKAT